jgi:short subunit dehydrogenase-like uncharacterized protein
MNSERVFDVLLVGATGSSGRFVAREFADRGLSILLAGRRLESLDGDG